MSDRVTARWSVDVNRPATDTFAYLVDMSRHDEWSPKPFRTEGLSPGPVSKGTTFTSYGAIPGDKEHRNEVEVTEVDPPSRLVFNAKEPKGEIFVNSFRVVSADNGCRVERTMDMPKPGGFLGLIFPLLLRAVIRPTVQKGMNNFKQRVESAAP
ncbi:MAG: SRPBCC family protein [Acidimicrobiales bacterium]